MNLRALASSRTRLLAALAALVLVQPLLAGAPDRLPEREAMIAEIAADYARTARLLGRERVAPAVRAALRAVPRHRFVPDDLQDAAYENRPLPIGYGQTISQPYIVAIMTDLLHLDAGDRVLEVGTGSGYQAAVLAQIVDRVFTTEIIAPLGKRSSQLLGDLGYANIEARVADGYNGWAEHAPFDAIIVTAAGDHIPPPLVAQLKPGGRMVIPVGGRFFAQELLLVEKGADGSVSTRSVLPVTFVPLTGGH